jgi:hypothetical protein
VQDVVPDGLYGVQYAPDFLVIIPGPDNPP